MSATAPVTVPAAASEPLADEALVLDRFELEQHLGSDPLTETHRARDHQTRRHVAVSFLTPPLAAEPDVLARIYSVAHSLASQAHPGLVAVYAVGSHGERHCLVRELLAGRSADKLIAERRSQGRALSLRGVYNVIAHVCKAVSALPDAAAHGALRPSCVWITQSGRVKLADADLGSVLVRSGRFELLPPGEQAFLAPEVKRGGTPDARSDVFGVGALLYALLTARSPLDAFVIPSQLRADASPQLDAVMMRCLAADPSQRYGSVSEVVRVIMPLVAAAPEPSQADFEVEVEIDADVAASLPPPGRRAANTNSLVPVVIASDPVPAAPPAPPAARARRAPPAAPKAPAPQASADVLADLTTRLTANDSPRWIVVKNGMDHGPFTARELIKLIVDGEVLEQNFLFNMASNQKQPLSEYEEFAPFVEQYRIRRDEREQAQALVRSKQVEKRSNAAKFIILAGSIGAILLVGGGYLMNRKAAGERQRSEADLAALYENGQVRISGTAGILKAPAARTAGARRAGERSNPGPGGFSSYEDAMNQAVEMNMGKAGGERQLSSSEVAGVMNRELNRMFGCVGEELRRGGKLGNVVMDLAILGNGRVAGASVNAGSAAFQRCLATKLRDVRFPDFPAPRMGARYSFHVD